MQSSRIRFSICPCSPTVWSWHYIRVIPVASSVIMLGRCPSSIIQISLFNYGFQKTALEFALSTKTRRGRHSYRNCFRYAQNFRVSAVLHDHEPRCRSVVLRCFLYVLTLTQVRRYTWKFHTNSVFSLTTNGRRNDGARPNNATWLLLKMQPA